MNHSITRRQLATVLPLFVAGVGVGRAAEPAPARLPVEVPLLRGTAADAQLGLSRNREGIHQEVFFKAPRKRVYEALLDTAQFDRVTALSAAMGAGPPPGAKPTQISRMVGGEFLLFGGQISGRQIELVAATRIVQAWRVANWDPGDYSVARFALKDKDAGTQLIFDHGGFPSNAGEHLAEGWKSNYWEPLTKFLA